MRGAPLVLLAVAGAVVFSSAGESVTEIDGSNDHRIFCVGALTRLLLEPVVWRLVDTRQIDLDWTVGACLKTPIPPDYDGLTLRALHAGRAPLPDDFPQDSDRSPRENFVRGFWSLRTRVDFSFDAPRASDVAYALFWFAVSERLGQSMDALCQTHLVEPYGLRDTSLAPVAARRNRMVAADEGGARSLPDLCSRGLLSSPHDVLRLAYVILPHLSRAESLVCGDSLLSGHAIARVSGVTPGGAAFLGFDREAKRALLFLSTDDDLDLPDLLARMEVAFGGVGESP